jgi:hypothetical protein
MVRREVEKTYLNSNKDNYVAYGDIAIKIQVKHGKVTLIKDCVERFTRFD